MTASSGSGSSSIKHTRTLTNVGPAGTYKVNVIKPSNSVKVVVEPETLAFTRMNEQKSYTVTFTAPSMPSTENVYARIEWSDGKHVVSSPVAISWT
uniref:Subtilisin-like protease fibronectin type-III domain-containing protein n=2 Tax=Solanum lycopersicum TaxID=4081 RepID=A0A3Q7G5Y8_SOLLC